MNIDIERLRREQLESKLRHVWDDVGLSTDPVVKFVAPNLEVVLREFVIRASVEVALYNQQQLQNMSAHIAELQRRVFGPLVY